MKKSLFASTTNASPMEASPWGCSFIVSPMTLATLW
jgi:hypothetical protein